VIDFHPFLISFLLLYVLKLFTEPFFYLCVKCKCNRESEREREWEWKRRKGKSKCN
jgi:hypothetical protein